MLRTFVNSDQYLLFHKVLSTVRHSKAPPPVSVMVFHGVQNSGKSTVIDLMKHMIGDNFWTQWTPEQVEKCRNPKIDLPHEVLDKRFIFLPEIKERNFVCLDVMHRLANTDFERSVQVKYKPGLFVCALTDSFPNQRSYIINTFESMPKRPMYIHFPNQFTKDQNSEDTRLMRIYQCQSELMQTDRTLCNSQFGHSSEYFDLKKAWD